MTLILRWTAGFTGLWSLHLPSLAELPSITSIPSWALATFIPSPADQGDLSLFEIDNDSAIDDVAAALAMRAPSINEYKFLAIERQSLDDAGITIVTSPGDTRHQGVDAKHRHVSLSDAHQCVTLASAFIREGELRTSSKKMVEQALERSARADQFLYQDLALAKDTAARDKTWSFIKSNYVRVVGNPRPST